MSMTKCTGTTFTPLIIFGRKEHLLQPALTALAHKVVADFALVLKSKFGFYIIFNSQGYIGTAPQHCHLWESNSLFNSPDDC